MTRSCLALLATALVALVACEAPGPTADPVTQDASRCAAAGFEPGSAEMAGCMRTAAQERSADKDRAAVQAELQAERDRQDQARRDAEWQKSKDDFEAGNAKRRAEAAAVMNGTGDIFGDATEPQPLLSAAAIPGMECTGAGDDAACDALSEY